MKTTPRPRPEREIRARFDSETIRVYQAYSEAIAGPALREQRFVPPFSLGRMTWIKPSFAWMMYRSGWGDKPGQERILAIDITRHGFEWALAHSSLSHFEPSLYPDRKSWESDIRNAPVRIQWDPERDLRLQPLPWRSLQVGLGPQASREYAANWIRRITDVTGIAKAIQSEFASGISDTGSEILEKEQPYPLADDLAGKIGCSSRNRPGADTFSK